MFLSLSSRLLLYVKVFGICVASAIINSYTNKTAIGFKYLALNFASVTVYLQGLH